MKTVLFEKTFTPELLANIRKHSDGVENMKRHVLKCHYCGHNSVYVYEDAQGHVQLKCSKCNCEAIYDVAMFSNEATCFRLT